MGLELAPSFVKRRGPAIVELGGVAQCSLVVLTYYSNEVAGRPASVGKRRVVETCGVALAFGAHVVGDG